MRLLIYLLLIFCALVFPGSSGKIGLVGQSVKSNSKIRKVTELPVVSVAPIKIPVKKNEILSLLLPWLYFMSTSLNIPTLPRFINKVINKGDTNVSPESAKVYGYYSGFDSLFTFLSVNAIGVLSDKYGRKPFMIYSSAGLGLAYLVVSFATCPWQFFVAGSIDGCTSCMLSQV